MAQRQADAMVAGDALSHNVGGAFQSRLAASGIVATEAGENLGAGYFSLDEAMAGWRGSAEHDANLRMAGFTRMGVAIAKSPHTHYGVYWALDLAADQQRVGRIARRRLLNRRGLDRAPSLAAFMSCAAPERACAGIRKGEGMMIRRLTLATAAVVAFSSAAFAADVIGEWARDDGKSKVRFTHCGGGAVCGSVTWLRDADSPAKVGQQVFFDMKPSGDATWAGSAFNPDDGRTYSGKMTLSGDHLNTAGCILGGLICKSVDWSRAK